MNLRPFVWAAYAIAFLLVVVPMADSVVNAWPMRIGEVTWRIGAAGLIVQAVPMQLLGMLLALGTAAFARHRTMVRILALLAALGGVVGILAMGMFGLDALEGRSRVRVEALAGFDRTATMAFIKYFLGSVTAVLLAIGGWKASRALGREGAGQSAAEARLDENSRVLIGRDPR